MTATTAARPLTPSNGHPKINPPLTLTPPRGINPAAAVLGPPPRLHSEHCTICTDGVDESTAEQYVKLLVDAVADEAAPIGWPARDPQLTVGQLRLFNGERGRLFRLLDRRTEPAALIGAIILLDDLAGQAPAVDAAIAEEDERRRRALTARPTLAKVLTRRPEGDGS